MDGITAAGRPYTLARDEGHQIRLVHDRQGRLRVTCRCLLSASGVARWSKVTEPEADDHWQLYNRLPHDPAAGPFEPIDAGTGAEDAG